MKKLKIVIRKILLGVINKLWCLLPKSFKLTLISKKLIGVLDYNPRKIMLMISSEVSMQRLNSCSKEPQTVEWICTHLEPSDVFYDIGSNTGSYSLIAATLLNREGRVVSFEPVPSTFIELCQNIQINKLEEIIIPINLALSDENAIVNFGLNSFNGGVAMHLGISNESILSNNSETVFQYLLETKTLEEVVSLYNLPLPNLIKIDVDGPEFNILKGSRKILKSENLKSLQVEIDHINQPVEEIILFLKEQGLLLKEKHKHGSSEIYDFVFTRKKLA